MEMVAAAHGNGAVPPFHDHDVREWSRIDSLTGVLEKARLETDHWTANTNNSCHKYGKVVDSRARTNADGALQQQARRQLEVFQSQIPGGHLQVIKTQTVSSSRWSNKTAEIPLKDFENLQLTLNPLDLTSQKSKVNVGRSVGRRPPSRPRALRDESNISDNPLSENLQRVSRICHQVHENAVKQVFAKNFERPDEIFNGHNSLTRIKSTSSEDLTVSDDKSVKSSEDLEDLEQLQNWRRTSKLRRSLQYPKTNNKTTVSKPDDLPENSGSVRKIREELEKGRRLNTALRGNNVDLEALDQILQTISNSSEEETKTKQKRNSFVSVETLQEVRGRLRRTSTDTSLNNKEEETDDGIVTEDNDKMNPQIRSYVFGMDSKKPILGTGSLESRTKLINGTTNLRSEDWYNRRKSYGFEQVHNHSEPSNTISLRSNGKVESSTDSGICRSSEIVTPTKIGVKQISSFFDQGRDVKSTTITIPITSPWDEDKEIKRHSIAVDESKYVRRPSNYNDEFLNLESRKSKKVEFCKTEVHFAADSGKVNIVETDEKPPPTNNFRRRRRNSGPLLDHSDFNTNGLPMLHFGDTSYEKTLLGVSDQDNTLNAKQSDEDNIYENVHSKVVYGNVTVNTHFKQVDTLQDDENRREIERDVKGILKNKPIKPTPYHLGEEVLLNSNSDSDTGKWGVKLKPIQKSEPLFWKSTVTLQNTVYGQDDNNDQPEFQKLLRNLRPTNNIKPDLINNTTVKLNEDNKIYSTKVNFGDGGTAVVENDRFDDKVGNSFKDSKEIFNKGLVVRIGRDDYTSKLCSKTCESKNATTTTTKITIDLNPSSVVPRVPKRSHSFKSTSLILDTLNKNNSLNNDIPQQLEALKKLYDEAPSDSDADKEIQVIMGHMDENDFEDSEKDNTSVVSGSWSKMTAYKTIREHINKANLSAKIEKGVNVKHFGNENIGPKRETNKTNFSSNIINNGCTNKFLRRTSEDLSSPSLVGRNSHFVNITDTKLHEKHSSNDIVLRQPKKSEMTYFGVNVSPKPTTKKIENKKTVIKQEKPDLLQHMKIPPPSSSPELTQPIYENVPSSNIIDELTKAADQILKAVNGFDDDDEECDKEVLETISESKSWKEDKKSKVITRNVNKSKLKYTSSTSSVESLSRDPRRLVSAQTKKPVETRTSQIRKKHIGSCETHTSVNKAAATKARRLQRASSREALLQSHGSSSEDLGANVEVPQRKPRQIKKTKVTQLTVSNGLEMKKNSTPNAPRRRRDENKSKNDRVDPVPEIRHKTAVSTIKSVGEKEKSHRERSRTRTTEDSRHKIPHQKRDNSRGLSTASKSSPRKSVSSRETVNHRISTANIKKCQRADGGARH